MAEKIRILSKKCSPPAKILSDVKKSSSFDNLKAKLSIIKSKTKKIFRRANPNLKAAFNSSYAFSKFLQGSQPDSNCNFDQRNNPDDLLQNQFIASSSTTYPQNVCQLMDNSKDLKRASMKSLHNTEIQKINYPCPVVLPEARSVPIHFLIGSSQKPDLYRNIHRGPITSDDRILKVSNSTLHGSNESLTAVNEFSKHSSQSTANPISLFGTDSGIMDILQKEIAQLKTEVVLLRGLITTLQDSAFKNFTN